MADKIDLTKMFEIQKGVFAVEVKTGLGKAKIKYLMMNPICLMNVVSAELKVPVIALTPGEQGDFGVVSYGRWDSDNGIDWKEAYRKVVAIKGLTLGVVE